MITFTEDIIGSRIKSYLTQCLHVEILKFLIDNTSFEKIMVCKHLPTNIIFRVCFNSNRLDFLEEDGVTLAKYFTFDRDGNISNRKILCIKCRINECDKEYVQENIFLEAICKYLTTIDDEYIE